MNLSDIIALAKQGYKPADIRELIALGNEQEKQKQPDPQPDPEPIPPPEPVAEPAPEQEAGTAERPPEAAADAADTNTSPDPQIEDLKRQIAELQAANARRGQPDGQKSNEEILAEMAKGFV